MTAAPDLINSLVTRFADNLASYRSGAYNETQLRREFLDPFFETLGWDVFNKQGYAEAYKDVIHEPSIKKAGRENDEARRAPDYAFCIGGKYKFFVEAKKPSVNIKEDLSPAFQLRRYAWSTKLPLSILTDFEEFAVYDCRSKPDRSDKVSTGRLLFLTFADYLTRWDEIAAIFSREAVLKGSFDRYAETTTGKHGTAEVDDAFLAEIERWRDSLARNIAMRNPQLTSRDLNYAVQMTIDRLIFLRIAEDRGIEPYGELQKLGRGAEIYPRLGELFRKADQRYNSGLFHFTSEKTPGVSKTPGVTVEADHLTLHLSIDDKPLKDILSNLYYPDSPYEFSVLPADILGQVYEQFLGKVIRLTTGHRAVVEDKPEVKKAGGVFYTPTYIVEYIVRHTLGELLKEKQPGEVGVGRGTPLRVLDPACGSGSFLLGAYQHLLDWYRDGYIGGGAEKWARGAHPRLVQVAGGEWKLTTAERKRILLDHIYGVDIDPQAVEVTKLSLLLKVLEGESEQTLGQQMALFQERALPDLGRNIQCGNSLIGSDFYHGQQASFLDLEEQYRINAFDWEKAFPQVFLNGGFEVVIGNPPYVRQESLGVYKDYFQTHYQVYHGMADLYAYFIERGVKFLKPGGLFGYIVANKWMRANYGQPLRAWMGKQHIIELTDFGDLPVFEHATTYPCILIIQKDGQPGTFQATNVLTLDFTDLNEYQAQNRFTMDTYALSDEGWSLIDQQEVNLLRKLRSKGKPLGQYVNGKVFRGVLTGLNEAFIVDEVTRQSLISQDPRSAGLLKPFLIGREVKRYQPGIYKQYLIFIPKGWTRQSMPVKGDPWKWLQKNYPAIANHLALFAGKAEARYDKGEFWWELRACDYYGEFEKPKIIIPAIVQRASYTFDTENFYSNDKTSIIPENDLYLLGLMNSKVCDFVLHEIASTKRGGYYEYKPMYVSQLPIYMIDETSRREMMLHDQIVALVERVLKLNKTLSSVNNPTERIIMQRQIETTDREIDRLVYELYGLTDEEIKIVEGE